MKKVLVIFFILILAAVFIARRNTDPKVIIASLGKKGDIGRGNLKYRIYLFGVLPVGEANLSPEKIEEFKGQKVYHLSAVAQSLDILARFFKGEAILDSYVDIQSLSPVLFKQKLIVSNKPDIEREVLYDQKNAVMTLAGVKRQILPNTQDPLSMILNIRRMDFTKTSAFEMNINTNQKNYILEAKAEQESLVINKVKYNISLLKAEIRRRDKNPYHKSAINMVLVEDKENIPVLIKVKAGGAFISVKLVEIQ